MISIEFRVSGFRVGMFFRAFCECLRLGVFVTAWQSDTRASLLTLYFLLCKVREAPSVLPLHKGITHLNPKYENISSD